MGPALSPVVGASSPAQGGDDDEGKEEKKRQTLSQGGFSAVEGSVWDQARQREPAPITLVPLVSGHLYAFSSVLLRAERIVRF